MTWLLWLLADLGTVLLTECPAAALASGPPTVLVETVSVLGDFLPSGPFAFSYHGVQTLSLLERFLLSHFLSLPVVNLLFVQFRLGVA